MSVDITLKNSNVNGGTAVSLRGGTVTYNWKNRTQVKPLVSTYDNVEADFLGFENVRLSVSGVIDSGDNSSNIVTQELLMDFSQEKESDTTVAIVSGKKQLTQLNGSINDSVTTVTVDSGSSINNGDYLQVDNEIILVSSGGGTTSLTVVRAKAHTSGASHANNSNVYLVKVWKGRPTAGYSVGGTYTDTLKVVVDNFSMSSSVAETLEGARVNYSVSLIESQ